MTNPMQYSMKPMHHRGMDRRHLYRTSPDTRTPEQKQRDLDEIRERLYRNLGKARDINRVDCPVCHGLGNIKMWAGLAGDTVMTKCTECNGEGRVAAEC
jgi:hypothetical protein